MGIGERFLFLVGGGYCGGWVYIVCTRRLKVRIEIVNWLLCNWFGYLLEDVFLFFPFSFSFESLCRIFCPHR